MRADRDRHWTEGGRGAFDFDSFSVLQPSARRGEEQTKRFRAAIVVQVPVLDQKGTQHREKVSVGCTVRRAVKETAAVIDRRERASFGANKGVARKALREHPVETDQP